MWVWVPPRIVTLLGFWIKDMARKVDNLGRRNGAPDDELVRDLDLVAAQCLGQPVPDPAPVAESPRVPGAVERHRARARGEDVPLRSTSPKPRWWAA